jgi:hypothetical protein
VVLWFGFRIFALVVVSIVKLVLMMDMMLSRITTLPMVDMDTMNGVVETIKHGLMSVGITDTNSLSRSYRLAVVGYSQRNRGFHDFSRLHYHYLLFYRFLYWAMD